MFIYSGYIDCGNETADYEFESDDYLNGYQQLEYLLESGMLQIVDNEPVEADEEED